MKNIQKWLSKHTHRQEKFVSLYDMMFDGCDVSYLSFRLSLFNLQVLFHYFSHMVMFYFMFHQLALKTFTILIMVSAVKMLVSAGWWGGLEVLRSHVRKAYHAGNKEEVNQITGFWIQLAVFFSLPAIALAAYYAYVGYGNILYRESAIEAFFIVCSCLTLAIQLPLGAYHAGIYGFSRIMRPRFSMILPFLIGICILLFSWSLFRQYAILLSIASESVTSVFLTFYYTSYMYKLYKLEPVRPSHQEFKRRFFEIPTVNFILGSMANIFIMSDALLIIAFYFWALGDPRQLMFIQIVFLISPLIRASSDWARLFYFDRKQLENDQLSLFISKYEKSVSRVASFLGFSFGVFACVSSYLLISPAAGANTLIMLPFFLMRSLIANKQVKAYTYSYYYDVIVSGALVIVSVVGVYVLKVPLLTKGVLITVAMIVVNAFLKRYRLPCCPINRYQNIYTNLYNWLATLVQIKERVDLYKISLDKKTTLAQKMGFINRLSEELDIPGDHICVFGDYPLLVYLPVSRGDTNPINATVAMLGKGIVSNIEHSLIAQQSTYWVGKLPINVKNSPFIKELTARSLERNSHLPHFSTEVDIVTGHFMGLFPNGIYYNPGRHLGPEAEPLPYETVRKFNFLIWEYLYQRKSGRSADVDLSLLFEAGVVRVIFVIPRNVEDGAYFQKIHEWHDYLHAVNVAESFQYADEYKDSPIQADGRLSYQV